MRRLLVEDYGVEGQRVVVVGEGINLSAPDELERSYDGRTILFVGYELERKGGAVLLEAFERVRRELPDAELLVAGPKHRPPSLPAGVRWLGAVQRDGLARLYESASLLVLPSLFEPFGWCTSRPWSGSSRASAPASVRCRRSFSTVRQAVWCHRGTSRLAETIVDLLRRPALLREMGERGRRHARERFTWPEVARRVDARLRQVAGQL